MIDRTFFNVTLPYDMIAQAYADNESHNSYCFLLGPVSNDLPTGFEIKHVELTNEGHLIVEYENDTGFECRFYIENGDLFVEFKKGGVIMALVDLGNVVGPQGPTGATGAQGPAGADGISPTFVLGDGTGGTTEGHLYADYDHPYVPT